MFDAQDDASLFSRDSRMPSLVMENGQSIQEYYAQLQLQAGAAPGAPGTTTSARPRRNSASSVMSENERLYGWSGSKGGVSNEATAPKYRISSSGKLTLAPTSSTRENTPTSDRPALRTARSDGQVSKPMYRPAFAPSADLPSSEDENDEDLDRVIQHDLPTSRPLKPRSSLKQKLGSVLARVGSVRRGSSPPSAQASLPVATSSSSDSDGAARSSSNNLSSSPSASAPIKRGATISGLIQSSTSARPRFDRKGSSSKTAVANPNMIKEESEPNSPTMDESEMRKATIGDTLAVPTLMSSDETAIRDSEGGTYSGGITVLARKLSRRATTGGASARARGLREERERAANAIEDKEAAEDMLRRLADIPLHKPPRSAGIANPRPLSSFPPRAALRTSADSGSLANAPRYSYYQRSLKNADGPRRRDNNNLERAQTVTQSNPAAAASSGISRSNRPMASSSSRNRSGSTPSQFSVTSTTGLLSSPGASSNADGGETRTRERASKVPPVPPLPEVLPDPIAPSATAAAPPAQPQTEWTQFKESPSSHSLAAKAL